MNSNMIDFQFRLVDCDDAEFILSLRTDPKLSRFIHPTANDLDKEIEWIRQYKSRELLGKELFFIFEEEKQRVGTYRIVNINDFSFTIGSWVFGPHLNRKLPKMVDLLMSDMGFRIIKRNIMLFDVRKKNQPVIESQTYKYPVCYNEDELSYYYFVLKNTWEDGRMNYLTHYDFDEKFYDLKFNQLAAYYQHLVSSGAITATKD